MIVAVVDTSTLVSGALIRATPPSRVIDLWKAHRFQLVVSSWILDELSRTLHTGYFLQRLGELIVDEYVQVLRSMAVLIDISVPVDAIATHPEDDQVLATAISADADYLVTSDTKMQRLVTHRGITILSPRDFVDLLEGDVPEANAADM